MTDNNINGGNQIAVKKENKALLTALLILTCGLIVLAIIGFCFLKAPEEYIEGQADATSVRVSGKLPGRVSEFFVKEGDTVHKGDTLVHIHSSLAEARLFQAQAMEEAAAAQNKKSTVAPGVRSSPLPSSFSLRLLRHGR